MIDCPFCECKVEKLKSNSHVIPRFLCKQTKEDGKNVLISAEKINVKNWRDIKGDIVCKNCENEFKKDDDFFKDFIDNQKYLIEKKEFQPSKSTGIIEKCGIEVYDGNIFILLKKAIFSIYLRYDLYLQTYENRSLIGTHFNKIRKLYLNHNQISAEIYPTCVARYYNFDGLGYPTRERSVNGVNCVFLILKKYRFWTYVDQRHLVEDCFKKFVINKESILSILIDSNESRLENDLLYTITINSSS